MLLFIYVGLLDCFSLHYNYSHALFYPTFYALLLFLFYFHILNSIVIHNFCKLYVAFVFILGKSMSLTHPLCLPILNYTKVFREKN